MRIPHKQLQDLGFIEISNYLYMKEKGSIRLYRDYRKSEPSSYASSPNGWIQAYFKEFEAIRKIENNLEFIRKQGAFGIYAL